MTESFLNLFRSPSGAAFSVDQVFLKSGSDILYGTVRTDGNRYPIVDGILIYKHDAHTDTILRTLDRKKFFHALQLALDYKPDLNRFLLTASPHASLGYRVFGTLVAWLSGKPSRRALTLFDVLNAAAKLNVQPFWTAYLKHRFSATSFRAALPLIQSIAPRDGFLIDIGCGIGTASYMFSKRFAEEQMVCQNLEFAGLYLARRFVVPDANFLCSDFGTAQPFSDGSFAAVFSSDAIQYVANKSVACAEAARLLHPDGTALLVHNHTPHHKDFSGQRGRGELFAASEAETLFRSLGLHTVAISEPDVFNALYPSTDLL
jgi:trans-aconitate methyltransferase